MKICIFANEHKHTCLQELLKSHSENCIFYEDYDEFIDRLPQENGDILIVARDGADGMESVRAAKVLLPNIPLIWFSDDKGFCPESYRVGCNYFSAAPISEEIIKKALKRCESI